MNEWALDVAEVVAYCGRPDRDDSVYGDVFTRRGATRPLITVEAQWEPGLTARQRARGRLVRTARAWRRMMQLMDRTGMTMQEFIAGLSNEELARGQLKAADGTFRGRPPSWVPRDFHREALRELMRRGRVLWQENYVEAVRVMTDIAMGKIKGASPAERLKAAQYVVERMEGKIPDRVEVQVDAPWQEAIMDIVAEVSQEQIDAGRRVLAGEVVEGEIVNEPSQRRRRAPR